MSAGVSSQQRFTPSHPCPICGGFGSASRGAGERCFGYLSADGEYAHCTREENALPGMPEEECQTVAHRLIGSCKCGITHGGPSASPAPKKAMKPDRKVEEAFWEYFGPDGEYRFEVVRWRSEYPDGRVEKDYSQRRRDPENPSKKVWNLQGVERVPYRLPELLAADPAWPAFVVEGEKCVEALLERGLVSTTNPGGATKWFDAYSHWLGGRHVVILPDNDLIGRKHGFKVAESVTAAGADSVRILNLPNLPPKGDVFDWLAAGGTAEELVKLAAATPLWDGVVPELGPVAPPRPAKPRLDRGEGLDPGAQPTPKRAAETGSAGAGDDPPWPPDAPPTGDGEDPDDESRFLPRYGFSAGHTLHYARENKKNGAVSVTPHVLADFEARIVEDVLVDDGAEVNRFYHLEGKVPDGRKLERIRIRAEDFHAVGQWSGKWGSAANVRAGTSVKDRFREAIQVLSKPRERSVYSHTGWRELPVAPGTKGSKWGYLHAAGVVASALAGAHAEVALEGILGRYRLPEQPASEADLVRAVQASLLILDVAPLGVTAPLLGAVGLAPLAHWVKPDLALWLWGRTGSFKSELAALAQGHWGAFTRTSLTDSWSSTANAIEARLFGAKDALYTLDDYAPQPNQREQQALATRASSVIRNMGNSQSRGRLRADLTLRPDRPPRCMLLVTGELPPPDGSVAARCVQIPLDRSDVDIAALTRAQIAAPLRPVALRGYLEWLAPRLDGLSPHWPAELAMLRETYVTSGAHARQPEALAKLHLGLATYLDFASELGAISDTGVADILAGFRAQLGVMAERQSIAAREAQPGVRFLAAMSALLAQQRIALQPDLQAPLSVREVEQIGDRTTSYELEHVGWADHRRGLAYLDKDLCHRRASLFFRDAQEHWPVASSASLCDALVEAFVITRDEEGRPTRQKHLGPQRANIRVLVLPLELLLRGVKPVPQGALLPDE